MVEKISPSATGAPSIKLNRCNSYTTVCLPVRGDNPRALASGLFPIQADKPK